VVTPLGSIHSETAAQTPRQVLDTSGAKTNPEKIVALANKLVEDGTDDTFKASHVKAAFERAREAVPKNLGRDISTAVRQGWIADSEAVPGSFFVTDEGRRALEVGFSTTNGSKIGKTQGAKKARAPRTRTKVKVPEMLTGIDEIPSAIEGIRYSAMKSPRDRLLWSLWFARAQGLDGLDNSSITWITDHLQHGISGKHVGVYFGYNKKDGYATESVTTKLKRITDEGIDHLKSLSAASS
jgi:hypothetical protein